MPLSKSTVNCICDRCGRYYTQRFHRNTDICYAPCRKLEQLKGNSYGSGNKGKQVPSMTGDKHPRWNPKKTEYKKYLSKIATETKRHKPIWSTWENADKIGRCGVEGAYQLDHMVSIKYGVEYMIPHEIIGSLKNLRIIPWEENRAKWGDNHLDLWDLLD